MAGKPALHSAPSWESCDSHVMFSHSPPSRKRKATQTDPCMLGLLKRACESPLDLYDGASSGGTQTEQAWDSPVKDIDLIASDSLEDDVEIVEDEKACSTCSSTHSEDWSFLLGGAQPQWSSLELTPPEHEAVNMSQSPTKSGDFVPFEVPPGCFVATTAQHYGFSPLVISVGTTYFQRLAAADPALKAAALNCPDFAPFMASVPVMAAESKKSVGAPLHQCQGARQWLLAVHLTCIYIAAKNLEVVPYRHLLRTMLERLHGRIVRSQQAENLEMEVLVALDWRLGPFFLNR